MPLVSNLFRGDPAFEDCLVKDSAHIPPGSRGLPVVKIQFALLTLEQATQLGTENDGAFYGPLTAAAVKSYKAKRSIINPAYESSADDIVGKMTIARLDLDMAQFEAHQTVHATVRSGRGGPKGFSLPGGRGFR